MTSVILGVIAEVRAMMQGDVILCESQESFARSPFPTPSTRPNPCLADDALTIHIKYMDNSLNPLLKTVPCVESFWHFLICCICVLVYLYFCICSLGTWEYHFWYPWTILFFKNIPHVGSFWHFIICCICVFVYLCICVFVYLCICVFVFFCICVFALCDMLYLCICVFVFVYLRVRQIGI